MFPAIFRFGYVTTKLGTFNKLVYCRFLILFLIWFSLQELRTLRFLFNENLHDDAYYSQRAMNFFTSLMSDLPADYASFFKKILMMLKHDYFEISILEVETKIPEVNEAITMPDANTLGVEHEIEEVTMGHVQELLERAYPNGLTLDVIAE